MRIRQLGDYDRDWAEDVVRKHFGSARVVSRGVVHDTRELPGLVAEGSALMGLLQYCVDEDQAEVVTVIAIQKRIGIGRTLMEAFREYGQESSLRRIWLVTTNNNFAAQSFYKAMGMRRCAVYPNAVVHARRLKPELPEFDEKGVGIRDEIEYEWMLDVA